MDVFVCARLRRFPLRQSGRRPETAGAAIDVNAASLQPIGTPPLQRRHGGHLLRDRRKIETVAVGVQKCSSPAAAVSASWFDSTTFGPFTVAGRCRATRTLIARRLMLLHVAVGGAANRRLPAALAIARAHKAAPRPKSQRQKLAAALTAVGIAPRIIDVSGERRRERQQRRDARRRRAP